jgi:hypothetical protein
MDNLVGLSLAVVAFLVLLLLALKKLVRAIGVPCQFCRNRKLTYFDELSLDESAAILEYFRSHERRTPDTEGVFVCTECRTVHDDFSGEKRSMDVDAFSTRTFCKVCNAIMTGCEPRNPDIRCPRCATQYQWQVFAGSGFRFLTPPAGAKVLERCRDVLGGV